MKKSFLSDESSHSFLRSQPFSDVDDTGFLKAIHGCYRNLAGVQASVATGTGKGMKPKR